MGHPTNQARVRRQRNDRVTLDTVARRGMREKAVGREIKGRVREREDGGERGGGGEISLR